MIAIINKSTFLKLYLSKNALTNLVANTFNGLENLEVLDCKI